MLIYGDFSEVFFFGFLVGGGLAPLKVFFGFFFFIKPIIGHFSGGCSVFIATNTLWGLELWGGLGALSSCLEGGDLVYW